MKVMIMPNFDKQNAAACTRDVCRHLREYGADVLMKDSDRGFLDLNFVHYNDFYSQVALSDAVIAIGGDGTMIHAAKHATDYEKPVLGINAGRLGFLAGLEPDELFYLKKLVSGEYHVEDRMMLQVSLKQGERETSYLALNDIVVSKGALARIVEMEVYSNDKLVSSYRADGVILATPTGSTAYALSAGGPIVEPNLDSISLTPLSPHSLFGRSILFAPDNVLRIRITDDSQTEAYLTVDGEEGIRLNRDDTLLITRSKISVKLIRLNDKPFYEVLNRKFSLRAKQ